MAYATDNRELWRRMADDVREILSGAKPGAIPIYRRRRAQRPTRAIRPLRRTLLPIARQQPIIDRPTDPKPPTQLPTINPSWANNLTISRRCDTIDFSDHGPLPLPRRPTMPRERPPCVRTPVHYVSGLYPFFGTEKVPPSGVALFSRERKSKA